MVTTISVDGDAREQFGGHEFPGHASNQDVLESMMAVAPTAEQVLEDGCTYCGETPTKGDVPEVKGGVVFFESRDLDGDTITGDWYFCSTGCLTAWQEESREPFPRWPDRVVVGGRDAGRTSVEGAEFIVERWPSDARLRLEVPGAFLGETRHDREIDYVGEPVWIRNNDKWVQSAVVSDVWTEDTYTYVELEIDEAVEKRHHPDRDRRRELLAERADNGDEIASEMLEELEEVDEMVAEATGEAA